MRLSDFFRSLFNRSGAKEDAEKESPFESVFTDEEKKAQPPRPPSALRLRMQKLLYTTPVEIWIGAMLGGAAAGTASYYANKQKECAIPVAFSEIGDTTRAFAKKGQDVPPLTRFYSVTNDVTMKVFESSNLALGRDDSDETFARELRTRVNATYKQHALISDYARAFPQTAQKALASLEKITTAEDELYSAAVALDKSWDYYSRNVYHTEYDTRQSCDADGKNCRTVTTSREVYDYTVHDYTYHGEHGARAAALLTRFLQDHPDMDIADRLHPAVAIGRPNREAILKSMKDLFDDEEKKPAEAELLRLANTWATGSTLTQSLPEISGYYNAIAQSGPAWAAASGTARNAHYRTYTPLDSGPAEFRTAERTLADVRGFRQAAHDITAGIVLAGDKIPKLDAQIREYVGVVLDGKAGAKPGRLRAQIMHTAREVYGKNFESGFDVQPFKWSHIVFFTLLGIGLGAGAGYGADRWNDKKRQEQETNALPQYRLPFRRGL